MRKSLIAIVTLIRCDASGPARAQAGAFATEFTQFLNHAQLSCSTSARPSNSQKPIKQTTDMMKNSKLLPGQVFGPISDLNALASIVQGGQALSYSLANLDSSVQGTISRATDTRAPATYAIIEAGRRRRWTRHWARFARPGCKASNSRVNSPC